MNLEGKSSYIPLQAIFRYLFSLELVPKVYILFSN